MSGGRRSGESVPAERHDDDDDEIELLVLDWKHLELLVLAVLKSICINIYIYII